MGKLQVKQEVDPVARRVEGSSEKVMHRKQKIHPTAVDQSERGT